LETPGAQSTQIACSGRQQRDDFLREKYDCQQQSAGNQAQRACDGPIHTFAIGTIQQDLSQAAQRGLEKINFSRLPGTVYNAAMRLLPVC